MNSRDKARTYLGNLGLLSLGREDELTLLLESHAAEARAEQREKVAAWMIHNGYSTGHGDTIEELLKELKDQWRKKMSNVEEMLDEQRNQCAMAAYRICGDDDVAQACLNAVEKSD